MSSKVYLRILRFGSLLALLTVFLVFKNLLFPYITSKQLVFNILVEALFFLWLVFVFKFPKFRPKKSLITWGLLAYLAALLLSLVVSVDRNLSFWGDSERMLGIFQVTHFFAFYFILITAFRSWHDWKMLFMFSVAVAAVESLLALNSPQHYGTLGNTSYVSAYLIFNMFFAAILFVRAGRSRWRWSYILAIVLMLPAFILSKTSGAIIGFGAGILLFIFLCGLFQPSRKMKRLTLGIFSVLLIALIFVFSQMNAPWFQKNTALRNLTFQKNTFQTRLVSWRGAAKDFSSHPLLGVGYGNYSIIFDRQFDSKFYDYGRGETYFDRAHNNLIEIVSTTGLVGLVAYLSIFVAVLYYIIRRGRLLAGEKRINLQTGLGPDFKELLLLISLISAYFIQNLAIFDSYTTYIGLMMILAYLVFLSSRRDDQTALGDASVEERVSLSPGRELLFLGLSCLVFLTITYSFNLKPWLVFYQTIQGYIQVLSGDTVGGLATYREAFSYNTPLGRDPRASFSNLLISRPVILSYFQPSDANAILDYAISLTDQNLAYNEHDSLTQMQRAQLFDLKARYNYKNVELLVAYEKEGLTSMDASISASPGRAPLYFFKSQMQMISGQVEEAVASAKYGISLNPNFPDGYCQLGQLYFFTQQIDSAFVYFNQCLDLEGVYTIGSPTMLQEMSKYYHQIKDVERAKKVDAAITAASS